MEILLGNYVPDVLVVLEGNLSAGEQSNGLGIYKLKIGSGVEAGKGVVFSGMKSDSKDLSTYSVVVDYGVAIWSAYLDVTLLRRA